MEPRALDDPVLAEIRAHMARRRVSQTWLANQLGMTSATISRRLSGKQSFTLGELRRVAEVLGITVTDLFVGPMERAS